ncbi:MAG TPA: hypothetical protein VMU21_05655 [Thermodesulfovibrionales bacterium]|nr:hypothetical protein [Thermodesulfovibrionales bacterium]
MKRTLLIALSVMLTVALVTFAIAAGKSKMELKAGDEIYACNCGESCNCDTMSRNAGKCTCGKEMVKAKVTKIEDGKAQLKGEGWAKERTFKTNGKYVCGCGPECKCDTISQNPGKCTCGKEMKKAS